MEFYVCNLCSQILKAHEKELHKVKHPLNYVTFLVGKEKPSMPAKSFNPADNGYVEVNKRIEEFYAKHPEGAIRTDMIEHILTFDEDGDRQGYVVMRAEVYRDARDEAPSGTGFSGMLIPGATPYTNGSEIENAETSAVGRAIANLGFEVKKSVASANEIRAKEGIATAAPKGLTALKKEVRALAMALYPVDWKNILTDMGITNTSTKEELEEAKKVLSA